MKNKLINSLSKQQLRNIVSRVKTIDKKKVDKMSVKKLIPIVEKLSYNQIVELSK